MWGARSAQFGEDEVVQTEVVGARQDVGVSFYSGDHFAENDPIGKYVRLFVVPLTFEALR